jgi:hypothetical protein
MSFHIRGCFYERNKLTKQDFGLCGPHLARGMLCIPGVEHTVQKLSIALVSSTCEFRHNFVNEIEQHLLCLTSSLLKWGDKTDHLGSISPTFYAQLLRQ